MAMCAKLLLAVALVASADAVFDIRRSGDHASGGSASQTRAWRAAWQFNLPAGVYEWKLQYRSCKDDRFVWSITNTSGTGTTAADNTARMGRAEHWAESNFVYTNMQREALRDAPGSSIQENIGLVSPTGGKLYQFIFNTSKVEACPNVGTAAAADAHAGHGHRRSLVPDFRRSGDEANKFVPKLNIQTSGYYVIFSDRNWEADYEGGLFNSAGTRIVAVKEEFPGVLSAAQLCPTADDDHHAATTGNGLDNDKFTFGIICLVASLVGGVLPVIVSMSTGGPKEFPHELCMLMGSGGLLGMFLQFYISTFGPENEGLLKNKQTGKYALQYALVMIGLCLMVVIEALMPEEQAEEAAADGVELSMEKQSPPEEDTMKDGPGVAPIDDVPVTSSDEDRQNACIGGDVRGMCTTGGTGSGSGNGGEVVPATEAAPAVDIWKLVNTVLLVVASTSTYVFQGLAMGMLTKYDELERYFTIMVVQCFMVGLAIGAAGTDSRVHAGAIVFGVFVFALSPLLGTIFGMGLNGQDTDRDNAHGSVMATTGGIMIYLSLVQLLKPYNIAGMAHNASKQLLFCLAWSLGAGSMCLVAITEMNAEVEMDEH